MCNFYFAVYYENGSWQAAGRRFGRVFGKWGFKWSGKKTFTWGWGGGEGGELAQYTLVMFAQLRIVCKVLFAMANEEMTGIWNSDRRRRI